MSRIIAVAVTLLALAGCQKVTRIRAVKAPPVKDQKWTSPEANWAAPKTQPRDHPIEFVSSDKPEWRDLAAFWNEVPPPLADAGKVRIKVPLGLPDPTPLIPAVNPPTVAKWKLGRKVFFERVLTDSPKFSCADCHKPTHGYVEENDISAEGARNTLSLLNVAYNRDQFWDGRVRDLEETLVNPIDAAVDPGKSRLQALKSHHFTGAADRLDQLPEYRKEFSQAFGIPHVTQDAVAKALATYLRTILSGDSVYDRAKAASPPFKDPTVEQFKAALNDDAIKRLTAATQSETPAPRDELAARIARGQDVFLGKAGCARCHSPGLFTNHQFYNTLISDSGVGQDITGRETGRFAVLPIGLKDFAMRGAYRTPTLRNLSATAPYMHNAFYSTLPKVIEYYSVNVREKHPLLAQPLRDVLTAAGPDSNSLLTQSEADALLHFLLALDGQPVDPKVMHR